MPVAALAALTGLIPVTVASGVTLKIAEAALGRTSPAGRRRVRRGRRARVGSGDFSNVGF